MTPLPPIAGEAIGAGKPRSLVVFSPKYAEQGVPTTNAAGGGAFGESTTWLVWTSKAVSSRPMTPDTTLANEVGIVSAVVCERRVLPATL